jgi:tol-pal system protein YbgF
MTRYQSFLALLLALAMTALLSGCGSSSETGGEEEQAAPPPTSAVTAPSSDSLAAQNQQLRNQVNALASENRALTGRVSYLEAQLAAARSAAQTAPPSQPSQPAMNQGAPRAESAESNADERTGYENAVETVRRHEYDAAIRQFQDLLAHSIRSDLADNCHYWLGESYYAQRKYDQAAEEFQAVIDMKTSDKTTDAMLMLGNTYAAQGKTADAKKLWNDLVNSWPTSPAASHAKQKLGMK